LESINWRDEGECRGLDPAVFYPDEDDEIAVDMAKAICESCPVLDACREHAIARREKLGIWGATTWRERRRIIRRRRAQRVA
jgi:WhiB family transcriptional regulator, redox-sensing transcriptional regulator